MALPIYPTSPMHAALQRIFDWNETVIQYDSGTQQADSPYYKPLYNWQINIGHMNELKQGPLVVFINSLKGQTRPFLVKDPYDYVVNSIQSVNSGITNAATLYLYDVCSYQVRPDTTTIASMYSVLSGFVNAPGQFSIEQDTGILTVNTKATADIWGARSFQYFRKARFVTKYTETDPMWNDFGVTLTIQEIP